MAVLALYTRAPDTPKVTPESSPEQIFARHREAAGADVHVGYTGLINSLEWHREDRAVAKYSRDADGAILERAVLVQSVEHYAQLQNDRPDWFGGTFDAATGKGTTFGENVLVSGADCASIAVGDVFVVEGGGSGALSSLVLEVSSPRKPCSRVDRKHGAPFGLHGARRHTLTNALAGWFCRVLVEGTLREGQRLVRQPGGRARPHSLWTLQRLSVGLFGGGSRAAQSSCDAAWDGDEAELRELVAMPQLAECEWREDARELLKERERGGEGLYGVLFRDWRVQVLAVALLGAGVAAVARRHNAK